MSITALLKPEYLFRPTQLARRLYWSLRRRPPERMVTRLSWGWPIEVVPEELHGKALLHLGICDLAVSEVLWRLCDPGETALDIGANIGIMTALLAYRVGRTGKVISFEADPTVGMDLQANVARWEAFVGKEAIRVILRALSDSEGSVRFESSPQPSLNRGLGRVVQDNGSEAAAGTMLTVPCSTLDSCLDGVAAIGVAKMDVEGHEEAVLHGGRNTLESRRVRDWVVEHHSAYPSAITDLFESHGYQLFWIRKKFFGPELVDVSTALPRLIWEPQSILATLDVDRVSDRLRARVGNL